MQADPLMQAAEILARCLGLVALRTSRAVTRFYDRAFSPLGLTSGQFTYLAHIGIAERLSPATLASRLASDSTTVTRNTGALQRMALVDVGPWPDDGRRKLLSLTCAGREVVSRATPAWHSAQVDLVERIAGLDLLRVLVRARHVLTSSEPGPAPHGGGADRRVRAQPRPALAAEVRLAPDVLGALRTQACICATTRSVARLLRRHYDGALRGNGLRLSQLHILAAVDGSRGGNLSDFVELLGCDQTTISRTFRHAEQNGYIVDKAVPGSRERLFALSEAGQRALSDTYPAWQRAQQEVSADDTPLAVMRSALLRLAAAVERA